MINGMYGHYFFYKLQLKCTVTLNKSLGDKEKSFVGFIQHIHHLGQCRTENLPKRQCN